MIIELIKKIREIKKYKKLLFTKSKFYNRTKMGFSTLFIVIILASAMTALILSLTASSFLSVKSGINIKYANQAKALTNACAEVALETLRENNNYIGTGSVVLNNNICNYTISNMGGNNRVISISGMISNIIRKIEITTDAFNPIHIVSWQEIP